MKKNRLAFFKSEDLHRVLILVIAVAVSYIAVISAYPYKKYDYDEYDIAAEDIRAPFEIQNTYLTEKTAAEKRESVPPVIIDNKGSMAKSLDITKTFLTFIYDLRKFNDSESFNGGETYRRTLNEFNIWLAENDMDMPETQLSYLINEMDDDEFMRFLNVTLDIAVDVMGNDIVKSSLSDYIITAQNSYRQKGLKQESVTAGQTFISKVIFANRETDEYLSAELRDKVYYQILQTERSVISEGDFIVRKGSVITPDKYNVLLQADLIRDKGIRGYLPKLMIFLYISALYIFILIYLRHFHKKVYKGRKEELILLLVVSLVLLLSRSALQISPYLIPLYIAPMMIAILLDLKLAIVMNVMLTFTAAAFVPQPDMIFTLFLGGVFSAILVQNKKQRSKLSLSGMFAAIISSVIFIVAGVLFGKSIHDAALDSVFVLIGGVFSIVITVGLLPLFETIFNIITPGKLLELSNPNHLLLKKLLMEAPGTYHHSLMVGNLAEDATDKIGGNALLARVGAYYHDVGKTLRPQYFTENQKDENPHDEMNPKLSSFVVVSHVGDGVKLAKTHKLPAAIIDFIKTHHGDSLTQYFYHKAKESGKNNSTSETDYRYSGPKPRTREGAVVMLADSVEAAVKSLDDKSEEKIESFIKKIIRSKMEEGQLDSSELTLKDLSVIAESFSRVLTGYYHKRVAYPEVLPEAAE